MGQKYTEEQVQRVVRNALLEFALAAGQVLRDHFSLTPQQVSEWMRLTTEQGQASRPMPPAEMEVKG